MTRQVFGGKAQDYVVDVEGGLLANIPLTFWDAREGGHQHTDLLLGVNPVSTVTSNLDGGFPIFLGPDGVLQMWADGGRTRVLVEARLDDLSTHLLTALADEHALAVAGDQAEAVARTAAISTAISSLVGGAPGPLDTLLELAAALAADESAAATLAGLVATKAPLASPALTGTPTINGVAAETTVGAQTKVTAAITALLNGAPGALDTLNELAAALTADESAAATLAALVGTKASLASPAMTGTPTIGGVAAETVTGAQAKATAAQTAAVAAAAADATSKDNAARTVSNSTYSPLRRVFHDDFTGATNGTLNGRQPLTGSNPWQTTGAQPTDLTSGRAGSIGTGYATMSQPTTGKVGRLLLVRQGYIAAGGGTTIAMTNDATLTLQNLIHLQSGATGFNLTLRTAGGAFVPILGGNWLRPQPTDGTLHPLGLMVVGESVTVFGPNGEVFSATGTGTTVSSIFGPRFFIEPNGSGTVLTAVVGQVDIYDLDGTEAFAFLGTMVSRFGPAVFSDAITGGTDITAGPTGRFVSQHPSGLIVDSTQGGAGVLMRNANRTLFATDYLGNAQVTAGLSFNPNAGTVAPAAGGAGALPATPAGYAEVTINGTVRKIAYY